MSTNLIRYEEKDRKHARRYDGAPYVDVTIRKKYMLEAVEACATKLVRLEFEKDLEFQKTAPVVIRGEDEQFKAIVMPVADQEG